MNISSKGFHFTLSQGLTGLQRPPLHDGLTSAYHPKNKTQLEMTVAILSCPILSSKNTYNTGPEPIGLQCVMVKSCFFKLKYDYLSND